MKKFHQKFPDTSSLFIPDFPNLPVERFIFSENIISPTFAPEMESRRRDKRKCSRFPAEWAWREDFPAFAVFFKTFFFIIFTSTLLTHYVTSENILCIHDYDYIVMYIYIYKAERDERISLLSDTFFKTSFFIFVLLSLWK